ncbi:MAG: hypothetical protein EOR76_14175 [Mesorhizobium sp.]|nr:MAG: hypothetical protein EOR76_14175 [Mesorhizobium sp.]
MIVGVDPDNELVAIKGDREPDAVLPKKPDRRVFVGDDLNRHQSAPMTTEAQNRMAVTAASEARFLASE